MVYDFHDLNFNDWSNNCSSRNCCKNSGLWVCSRKYVFSALWNDLPKTVVLVRSSFVSSYQLILVRNDASSQTLVNRIVSVSDSKSWLFSRKLLPDTCFEGIPIVLLLVISHMLIHLWPRILSVFLVPFLPPSGRIAHTNSKLLRKYWADLQNEWSGIRVRCSKHPYWSVWCLCHSSFSEFHN